MSRGVLAEHLWLEGDRLTLPDHHLDMARILSAASFVVVPVLGYVAIVTAIIATIMIAIAPPCLEELRADPRTRDRPGLSAAADRLEAWLSDRGGGAR